MEGVALEHLKKLKPYTIPMAQFHSYLFAIIGKNDSTTATHIHILIRFIHTKEMIAPLLTTM